MAETLSGPDGSEVSAGDQEGATATGGTAEPGTQGDPKTAGTAPGSSAESAKAAAPRGALPEGLYLLTWSTEQQEGMAVKMTVKTSAGSNRVSGARYQAEISTRNGAISGCVLSKEGSEAEPTTARCKMSDGNLVITLDDESGSGNAMEMRMAPDAKGDYTGTIALVSALLPAGRVDIGNASMIRVS